MTMNFHKIFFLLFLGTQLFAQEAHTGLLFADPAEYEQIGMAPLPYGAGEIPSQVDLSPKMPPVGNQGNQNSCVAWATAYAGLTYYESGKTNTGYYQNGTVNYRNILSPSYVYNQINDGQNKGTHFQDAFKLLMEEGTCTYQSMPYRENDWVSQPGAAQENEAKNYQIETYRRLNLADAVTSIKAELINNHPVIAASIFDLTYYNSGFNYSGADYTWRNVGNVNNLMGHAILIVGFDDQKNAFKFMNSWGENWGNRGFGYIDYQLVNRVIREAYIIKTKHKNTQTPNDNTPKIFSDTRNELNQRDIQDYGLNFIITNVAHENDMTSPGVPIQMRKMTFNGQILLPANLGQNMQIVVNFYVNNRGVKGVPVASNNYNYALANGQAATGTPVINMTPNQGMNNTWWAVMPYVSLQVPRGQWVQTPFGNKYQPITSYLFAEPVLFIDNFPVRVGQLIPFSVTL